MNNNFQNLNYARLSVGAIFVFVVIFLLIFVMLRLRNKAGDFEL
jgi:flagellar biogenesis protein FliO